MMRAYLQFLNEADAEAKFVGEKIFIWNQYLYPGMGRASGGGGPCLGGELTRSVCPGDVPEGPGVQAQLPPRNPNPG